MLTVFAAAIAQCGLDYGQAADLLKCSRSAVQKKCSLGKEGKPALPMTAHDARVLHELYEKIRVGDVDGEDVGVQNAARALRVLRGIEVPVDKPVGRPPRLKASPLPPAPESRFHVSPEARKETDDLMATFFETIDSGIPD